MNPRFLAAFGARSPSPPWCVYLCLPFPRLSPWAMTSGGQDWVVQEQALAIKDPQRTFTYRELVLSICMHYLLAPITVLPCHTGKKWPFEKPRNLPKFAQPSSMSLPMPLGSHVPLSRCLLNWAQGLLAAPGDRRRWGWGSHPGLQGESSYSTRTSLRK